MNIYKKLALTCLALMLTSNVFSAEIGGKIINLNTARTGTALTRPFAGYLMVGIIPRASDPDLSGTCNSAAVALKLDLPEHNIFLSQLLFAAAQKLYVQFQFAESEKIPGMDVCIVSSLLVDVP